MSSPPKVKQPNLQIEPELGEGGNLRDDPPPRQIQDRYLNNNNNDSNSAINRPALKLSSAILVLFLGIAEFIPSVIVTVRSHNLVCGGLYLGCIALVIGPMMFVKTYPFVWTSMTWILLFTSLVATILQGISYSEFYNLKACAHYTAPNDFSSSCSPNGDVYTLYKCYGDSSYFNKAESCATVNHGGTQTHCICAIDGENNCQLFKSFTDCNQLLDYHEIRQPLLIAFIFAIFLFVIALIITIVSMINNPEDEEMDFNYEMEHRYLSQGERATSLHWEDIYEDKASQPVKREILESPARQLNPNDIRQKPDGNSVASHGSRSTTTVSVNVPVLDERPPDSPSRMLSPSKTRPKNKPGANEPGEFPEFNEMRV